MIAIRIARTVQEIRRCFPVMAQLRPHLKAANFVRQIRSQEKQGYRLAFLADGNSVRALAGYRILEMLSWGKCLYVDDLVTDEAFRSCGHGGRLFAWLVEQSRAQHCSHLTLDSGVQRFGAHRFYLANRMDIVAHHFNLKLQ
jgi:GNAT superfamily N-acetyltransferase